MMKAIVQPESQLIRLPDQPEVILRPIEPDDASALIAMDGRISGHSRLLRYFGSARLSPKEARTICQIDPAHRMGLVITPADSAEQIVAVAFYVVSTSASPDEAEIAVLVEDAWQGMGLGTLLLTNLATYAVDHGIHTFSAYVHCENYPILHFVDRCGLPVTRSYQADLCAIRITLTPDRVEAFHQEHIR